MKQFMWYLEKRQEGKTEKSAEMEAELAQSLYLTGDNKAKQQL